MLINHSADKFICVAFRDEPYHGAGDYNVPYSGVPTHNTWSHPDVQQLQASQQQDARQQRCKLKSSKTQYTNHLSLAWGPPATSSITFSFHVFLENLNWNRIVFETNATFGGGVWQVSFGVYLSFLVQSEARRQLTKH